jgi:hypothetical protein
MFAIKATTSLKNSGSRLRLVSSLYTAVGLKMDPKPEGLGSEKLNDGLKKGGTTYNFAIHRESQLVAARSTFSAGGWIGPGEEVKRTFVFYVPEGVFDKIIFSTHLVGGNGLRFDIGKPCQNDASSDSEKVVKTVSRNLLESSFLNTLTRPKRCISSQLTTDEASSPSSLDLEWFVAQKNSPSSKEPLSVVEGVYGIFETNADTELSLWNEEDSKEADTNGTDSKELSESS